MTATEWRKEIYHLPAEDFMPLEGQFVREWGSKAWEKFWHDVFEALGYGIAPLLYQE